MKEVWPDAYVEEANLTVNISTIRKALGDGRGDLRYIETVPRRGYRFVAPVSVIVRPAPRVAAAPPPALAPPPAPAAPAPTIAVQERRVPPILAIVVATSVLLIAVILSIAGLSRKAPARETPAGSPPPEPALVNLTHNLAEDARPSYSPDGTSIAFSSNRAGK